MVHPGFTGVDRSDLRVGCAERRPGAGRLRWRWKSRSGGLPAADRRVVRVLPVVEHRGALPVSGAAARSTSFVEAEGDRSNLPDAQSRSMIGMSELTPH